MRFVFLIFAVSITALSPAYAQLEHDDESIDRLERLERDIQLLQRQLARGEPITTTTPVSEEDVAASGGAAQLDVRLSKMEDDMRALRGKVEEVEFQNRKLTEDFQKFQKDTEFRFGELSGAPKTDTPPASTDGKPERKPIADNPPSPSETTAGDGVLKPPAPAPTDDEPFATPRDHYNHAFRLLNQTKYEESAKSFAAFVKQYPKDPLVGNAYYWQGETYYIRRDYVAAADHFRQGFEVLPNGPKAADNLLKLAMSLNALQRDKEACIVLGQVVTKFKKSSTSVTEKAQQEQKRIGCS